MLSETELPMCKVPSCQGYLVIELTNVPHLNDPASAKSSFLIMCNVGVCAQNRFSAGAHLKFQTSCGPWVSPMHRMCL